MRHRIQGLFCAAAAVSLVLPVAAQAQQQSGRELQEVVVTAQRRSERLQDVPISVTAITADELASSGVASTRDLSIVTPGLRMTQAGAYLQPAIRGITSTVQTPVSEANVATYLDGVYQANTLSAVMQLPDVRQIEVLKGPQGTLFGRNATGGAILVTTEAPNLSGTSGQISAGYGNLDTKTVSAFVTGPLEQNKAAVSLTGFYDKTDGWQRNLLLGGARRPSQRETALVRGKIRVLPWDGADFTLTGFYSKIRDHSSLKQTNYQGNSQLRLVPGVIVASEPNTYAINVDNRITPIQRGVSLRGEIEVGPGTLTTTTAYNFTTTHLIVDADQTTFNAGQITFDSRFKTWSQEVLYSTDQLGRFRATVGAFYFRSSGGLSPLTFGGNYIWANDKDRSYAVFGELTYDVTDQLSVTGGLRYSYEKRIAAVTATPTRVKPTLPELGRESWDSVTPRVSVLYKATPDTNAYFTFSKGFKSGIFNTTAFQVQPVNLEKATNYELGVKSTPAPNFQVNAAVFYTDYKDLQVPSLLQVGVAFVQRLTNAATAEIYGAEIGGAWNVSDAFKLAFGGAYTHARYKRFPNAPVNIPTGFGGNTATVADLSGNTMIRSPAWTGNVTAQYTWDTEHGEIQLSATAFYTSKFYMEESNRVAQPAYEHINAQLAWRPVRDRGLTLKLWGRNLTNSTQFNGFSSQTLNDTSTYLPPRTYGVEATYEF